ncbi:CHRNA7-FAM7A fusion protein-like [Mizuhopecten yessoensis]|nr:CHRNA7-FAM7A fusion protein-like [Mizuhopecten yessoensis]
MNFLVSVVFPIIMLGLVNPLVFILPFTSGEISSYSMTVLLAFTVYMTVVSDKMPGSSDPISYVSYYILSLLAIGTLIVIANIFQIQIQEKNEEQEPVPKWICKFPLLLMKVERRGQVKVYEDSNILEKVDTIGTNRMNLESLDERRNSQE